ncbi:hypothetical protein P170DRAFT_460298 [Aspergillus steynii IBT 23096]|uniref:AB hydrolase-1 domain-containing protein n=1 Tax=Aspergillus steynii IBT 23096 TaxID=1392250 RepID=A0A2I2GMD3_9EURO|nr:uncharacterized protein P170DRAFT_460298 [Aspergillus steynii IBT 23096]PLB54051.1 hypothetical protein P170DRAFT_460298 [Aspergillus steynii IBT 23096]
MTTIALLPGAWISPYFYQPFSDALASAGFLVHQASYPSLNPANASTADCDADAQVITKTLRILVEDQGKDVVVLMHSYAGMPGAAAATGLAKSRRSQQGKSGGVIGLIFIGAFVVPEGLSCAGLQGGNLPPWILLDKPSRDLNIPDDPIGNFAGDVDPDLVKDLEASTLPHSSLAFNSPQPHPAWADADFKHRLAFIVTAEDRAVPKEAQYGMMAASQQEWIVKEMASSHCGPFLNRIDETIVLLKDLVEGFSGEI